MIVREMSLIIVNCLFYFLVLEEKIGLDFDFIVMFLNIGMRDVLVKIVVVIMNYWMFFKLIWVVRFLFVKSFIVKVVVNLIIVRWLLIVLGVGFEKENILKKFVFIC